MIETLPHDAFIRLAVTLWALWWARRKAIHEQIYQSPSATHQFISRFIADLDLLPRRTVKAPATPRNRNARPKAPPQGFAKIHVDVAFSRNHDRGAATAVCRDAAGNFQGSLALVINVITDTVTMEAIAYAVSVYL